MTETGEKICERQNDLRGIKLLAARQESFRSARLLFIAQFLIMVVAPLGAWTVVTIVGSGRPLVASAILFLTIFDVILLDRWQKSFIISASKIAQEFDCYVFQLYFDTLFIKSPEDDELISERSSTFIKRHGKPSITDWYSVNIKSVPLYIAILICQRTNVTYDKQVRKTYTLIIFSLLFVLIVTMSLVSISIGQSINFLIVALFLPSAPLLIWSFREWIRQKQAIEEAERVQVYLEGQLNGIMIGQIDESLARTEADRIQNAIYLWRAKNPLSFPGVYKLRRKKLEANMDDAAASWVQRYSDAKF